MPAMITASVTRRVTAEFSICVARHNSDARASSLMRQRVWISNRCIDVSNLTQAPIGMLMQVDGYRRRGSSWPVCVTSPGRGETNPEDPSDTVQNMEVPSGRNGGILREISEEARRRAAAALSSSARALGSSERPVVVETSSHEMRLYSIGRKDAVPGDVLLPRSFLAESVDGNPVECGSRGCRPLYINVLAEFFQITYSGGSLTEVDTSAVKDAFHAALASAPHDARLISEYAMFTWTSLENAAAAEELYNRALEMAPQDPNILASHALFLWSRAD